MLTLGEENECEIVEDVRSRRVGDEVVVTSGMRLTRSRNKKVLFLGPATFKIIFQRTGSIIGPLQRLRESIHERMYEDRSAYVRRIHNPRTTPSPPMASRLRHMLLPSWPSSGVLFYPTTCACVARLQSSLHLWSLTKVFWLRSASLPYAPHMKRWKLQHAGISCESLLLHHATLTLDIH